MPDFLTFVGGATVLILLLTGSVMWVAIAWGAFSGREKHKCPTCGYVHFIESRGATHAS